ncbi:MAG: amidohydrolase family protein [Pseudomonadota bacterium]|nr:amidohydrolase family protein [Pseudomonadota bacterium]
MAEKKNIDLLIDNGTVVTVDKERRVIRNGAVAIHKNKIKEVGKSRTLKQKYSAKRVYPATNKLITPGLVNSHIHFYHHMHRGLSPEHLSGLGWSDFVHRHVATVVDPDDEIWGGLGTLIETLKTGVTTFLEAGSYNLEETIEGVARIGMRGLMGRRSFDHVSQGHDMLVDSTRKCLRENERFMQSYSEGVGLVKPCIVLVGMGRCSDALYRGSKEMADEYGTVLHMHQANMLENVQEALALHGERPIEHLYNLGALGPNVVMVHMVHVNQQEIEMLASTRANVVHCPSTALKLAYGMAAFGRFPEMAHAGVNVAIGTDASDCSNFNDMVRLMYLAAATPKDYRYDAAAGSAEKALEMATINGAKALNMEKDIGSLEAGKKADLAIFDMHRPDWVPLYNELQNLVYSAQGSSCESVIIDGNFVMEHKKVLTIDEDEVVDRVQFQAKKMLKKTKIPIYSGWKWL